MAVSRALRPVPKGSATFEFQKLVESGTSRLRNHLREIAGLQRQALTMPVKHLARPGAVPPTGVKESVLPGENTVRNSLFAGCRQVRRYNPGYFEPESVAGSDPYGKNRLDWRLPVKFSGRPALLQ
jgi:hypothetical protein